MLGSVSVPVAENVRCAATVYPLTLTLIKSGSIWMLLLTSAAWKAFGGEDWSRYSCTFASICEIGAAGDPLVEAYLSGLLMADAYL